MTTIDAGRGSLFRGPFAFSRRLLLFLMCGRLTAPPAPAPIAVLEQPSQRRTTSEALGRRNIVPLETSELNVRENTQRLTRRATRSKSRLFRSGPCDHFPAHLSSSLSPYADLTPSAAWRALPSRSFPPRLRVRSARPRGATSGGSSRSWCSSG